MHPPSTYPGEALIKGLDVVKQAPQIRRLINLVSGGETPGYGILSVKENLWFFSQLYGLPRDFAKDRISKLVDQLELQDYLNTRMSKLSTGYKQRLNLARGFVNDPAVLFLDEPTLGLDVLSARHLRSPTWKIEITPNLSRPESVKAVPGVVGLSQTDNIETGVTTLKLVLEDESAMSDLLSKIRENGSRVLNMGKSEPTLEDVYISLVGTGLEQ